MKKVVLTAMLSIVLGTAWTLYLDHENKKFVDHLGKMDSFPTQQANTTDTHTTAENREVVAIDVAPSETIIEDIHVEREHTHLHPHPHSHTDTPEIMEETTDLLETLRAEAEAPQDSKTKDSFKDVRESQRFTMGEYAKARETFQRIYMNPNKWVKGHPGEVGSILALTHTDEMALAEANYILNPTEGNKKRLEMSRRPQVETRISPPPHLDEDYEAIPLRGGYTLYKPR